MERELPSSQSEGCARFIDAMALTDDKKATGKPADASNLESLKKPKDRSEIATKYT